jgi:hypothetical protein
MNEILARIIEAAIDPNKITGFVKFNDRCPLGEIAIVLNDGSQIHMKVEAAIPQDMLSP